MKNSIKADCYNQLSNHLKNKQGRVTAWSTNGEEIYFCFSRTNGYSIPINGAQQNLASLHLVINEKKGHVEIRGTFYEGITSLSGKSSNDEKAIDSSCTSTLESISVHLLTTVPGLNRVTYKTQFDIGDIQYHGSQEKNGNKVRGGAYVVQANKELVAAMSALAVAK